MAFFLAAMMFSLAGVPPLAGFFAKFYVFAAAMKAGLYGLSVIGVLASAVAAYYYLKDRKAYVFRRAGSGVRPSGPRRAHRARGFGARRSSCLCSLPSPITNAAMAAAQSLFLSAASRRTARIRVGASFN